MLARAMLLLIPALTFLVPVRWFGFYATLIIVLALYQLAMMFLLTEETAAAYADFGVEVVLAYIAANLALLALRYYLIRRARARILKLPAPETKE